MGWVTFSSFNWLTGMAEYVLVRAIFFSCVCRYLLIAINFLPPLSVCDITLEVVLSEYCVWVYGEFVLDRVCSTGMYM